MNVDFQGDDIKAKCNTSDTSIAANSCVMANVVFRPGDKIIAYSAGASTNCASLQSEVTCQKDGTFSPKGYNHIHCLPGEAK